MKMDQFAQTLQYLKTHPGFLKTYFRYIQLAQGGAEDAKQLLSTLVSSNPDMFKDINDLLKMANEGDAYAKQMLLDHLKE